MKNQKHRDRENDRSQEQSQATQTDRSNKSNEDTEERCSCGHKKHSCPDCQCNVIDKMLKITKDQTRTTGFCRPLGL